MIEKAVRKILGVEDSPKWLEREVLRKMEEGLDLESAVGFLAPWLQQIHRANLAKYRPGRGMIRKAAPFLTAETVERLGYRVEFVELFGSTFPAAVRGEGIYTPVVPIFDCKRRSQYIAAKTRKLMESVVQITTTKEVEGVLADVVKMDKPPYYYLHVQANLSKLIEESTPITATVNRRYRRVYYYWKHFRDRGYLVLVGKEIGGVTVDLLAVGLGRYAVVSGGDRKIARLRKVVDAVYLA
jgi:hypothetical protein